MSPLASARLCCVWRPSEISLREEGERLDKIAAGSSLGLGLGVTGIEGLCCSVYSGA